MKFDPTIHKQELIEKIRESQSYKNLLEAASHGFKSLRATSTPKGKIKVYFKLKGDKANQAANQISFGYGVSSATVDIYFSSVFYPWNVERELRPYLCQFTSIAGSNRTKYAVDRFLYDYLRKILPEVLNEDSSGKATAITQTIIDAGKKFDNSEEKKTRTKNFVLRTQGKYLKDAVLKTLDAGASREEIVKLVDETICNYIIEN